MRPIAVIPPGVDSTTAQCTMGIFPSGVRIEWAEQKEFAINIPPNKVRTPILSNRLKSILFTLVRSKIPGDFSRLKGMDFVICHPIGVVNIFFQYSFQSLAFFEAA